MVKYILVLISIVCSELLAQNTKKLDSVSFYGIFRQHVATYDGNLELQENVPRIGTTIIRNLQKGWYAKVKPEYGIQVVQGVSFNKDANSAQQLIANPFVNDVPFTP